MAAVNFAPENDGIVSECYLEVYALRNSIGMACPFSGGKSDHIDSNGVLRRVGYWA
ncbi:hypothetical protein HPP92_019318 [Vanilla planifolia]|uniref:Uncharacterized protein n=1 Tax=Vanilla planifolia TaxID=51239 RepID=A0A835UN86_VANPL|nr:hypothetical protein HPP92_019318 [Vanilla planifolia]